MYTISENNMFYVKKRSDKYTLIEKEESQEICSRCKAPLKNSDYIYRRKAPNVKTYVCSKCGYFEIYFEE